MRTLISRTSLLVLAVVLASSFTGRKDAGINDACKRSEAIQSVKKEMVPFRYERTTTTNITFKNYDQVREVAIPLFFDNTYKFVVNCEGLPFDIKVEVYDQPMGMRNNPVKIMESTDKQFTFELDETYLKSRVYVNYVVPALEDTEDRVIQKGCVVLASGYKNV
jgi:hypothetical protein